jgi:3',5'-cyclic-AMP phosphodiesterase
MTRDKYLWLTDCHLFPWQRYRLLGRILDEKPKGVIITGDISHAGQLVLGDLDFLGKRIGRPLYFITGNHDLLFSSFQTIYEGIRKLCAKHKNLIWLTESEVISLTEEVSLIGIEGWYDARLGNSDWVKWTFDHRFIREIKQLPSWNAKLAYFRELADQSAKLAVEKLQQALEISKTVYLATHFPPWFEANRASGTIMERFWTPYNTNQVLGQALEQVMQNHKKRQLVVISGHTHQQAHVQVSRNIECWVNKASYLRPICSEQVIWI